MWDACGECARLSRRVVGPVQTPAQRAPHPRRKASQKSTPVHGRNGTLTRAERNPANVVDSLAPPETKRAFGHSAVFAATTIAAATASADPSERSAYRS